MRQIMRNVIWKDFSTVSDHRQSFHRNHQSAGNLKSAKGYRTFSDGHSWGIRGI